MITENRDPRTRDHQHHCLHPSGQLSDVPDAGTADEAGDGRRAEQSKLKCWREWK